ncbi:MAG: hypothetical protein OXF84_08310 [Bacteroidetes bacterium]|nr:hypothetical protein [Bacteroidota bacterium]
MRIAVSVFIIGFLGISLLHPAVIVAQESAADRLSVYLDCDGCDQLHIRTELNFLNYVRDPSQADVHIFITRSNTVLAGGQYELTFIGRGTLDGSELNLVRVLPQDASADQQRQTINDAIRLGLAPFVGHDTVPEILSLTYQQRDDSETDEVLTEDPWKHWVFNLYGGDFELDLESNRTVFDSRWGFYADHRSEQWKARIRPYFNYDLVRIQRDGRPTVRSSISRHGLDSYVIRSLGPHWSVGVFLDYVTRNDRNLKHSLSLVPGVEYSLFPYDVATRRAITFVYQIGMTYTDYFETTIFGELQQWLPRHELDARVAVRRPWGDIFSGLEGSQYLHDPSKQRAEFYTAVSVRLFEGFSLEFQTRFEMIRDQLSLPAGELLLEEILLQQRELATDYTLSASIAFVYTFGSKFANVVNTRF